MANANNKENFFICVLFVWLDIGFRSRDEDPFLSGRRKGGNFPTLAKEKRYTILHIGQKCASDTFQRGHRPKKSSLPYVSGNEESSFLSVAGFILQQQ